MTTEITKGQHLAAMFRPFLSPGLKKYSDVDPTVEAMAAAIDNSYKGAIDILKELNSIGIVSEISVHKFNSIVNKARIELANLKEIKSSHPVS